MQKKKVGKNNMNENIKISLIMIVKNEEENLGRCLKSVKNIVDEIIIVDTGSQDNTKKVALSFGAKVFDFTWTNDFSEARNYAISKSTGDWNLMLDADEYIKRGTREDLKKALTHTKQIGKIELRDAFKRGGEIEYSKAFISRIAPSGVFYKGKIHEQMDSDYPRVNVPIEVYHDGYLHIDKSERNLEILFEQLKEDSRDAYMLYQIAHTLFLSEKVQEANHYFEEFYKYAPNNVSYRCNGIVDYIYNVRSLGCLEAGIKIIEKEKKLFDDSPDFHFVSGLFYTDLVLSDIEKYINYLPLIEVSYLRCLEIGETKKYDSVIGTGSFSAAYNLGIWYELSKKNDKARQYYQMALSWGYNKAKTRLEKL